MNLIDNIPNVNIISWFILGLAAGLIIHVLDPGEVRGGAFGTAVTGILGAFLGGFLSNLFLGVPITGLNIQSLFIAIVGAFILSLLERLVFRKTEHIKTTSQSLE